MTQPLNQQPRPLGDKPAAHFYADFRTSIELQEECDKVHFKQSRRREQEHTSQRPPSSHRRRVNVGGRQKKARVCREDRRSFLGIRTGEENAK